MYCAVKSGSTYLAYFLTVESTSLIRMSDAISFVRVEVKRQYLLQPTDLDLQLLHFQLQRVAFPP